MLSWLRSILRSLEKSEENTASKNKNTPWRGDNGLAERPEESPSWAKRLPPKVLFFDLETTGLLLDDRVVSFAGILLQTERLAEQCWSPIRMDYHQTKIYSLDLKYVYFVFNPKRASHPRAQQINGLDDWTLYNQPFFAEESSRIEGLFLEADLVVAHNAAFDIRFLRTEFELLGRTLPERPIHCTMEAWRSSGGGGSAKLSAVAAKFGQTRKRIQHGALEDAWLAMAVYLGMQTPVLLPSFEILAQTSPSNWRSVPPRPSGWLLPQPS